MLDAGSGFSSYVWSTKDSIQKITVKNTGVYGVLTKNKYDCPALDSILVTFTARKLNLLMFTPFTFRVDATCAHVPLSVTRPGYALGAATQPEVGRAVPKREAWSHSRRTKSAARPVNAVQRHSRSLHRLRSHESRAAARVTISTARSITASPRIPETRFRRGRCLRRTSARCR